MAIFTTSSDVWTAEPFCPSCRGHFVPDPPQGAVRCECGAALEVEYRSGGWWRIRPFDELIEAEVDAASVVRGMGRFLADQTGWVPSERAAEDDTTPGR